MSKKFRRTDPPEGQNGSATGPSIPHGLGSCGGGGQGAPKGGNSARFKGLILIESGESSLNGARSPAMDLLSVREYCCPSGKRWFEIPLLWVRDLRGVRALSSATVVASLEIRDPPICAQSSSRRAGLRTLKL